MKNWFLQLLLANWMHWTYCAQTRYGKSEFVRSWLVPGIRGRCFGCTVIDPAGTLINKLILDLAFMGRLDDVILIRFRDVKRTVGIDWMTPSRSTDELDRRSENELERERHKKRMLARQGMQNTSKSPLKEEYLNPPLDIWLGQDTPCPEYWILHIYEPDSREQQHLLAHYKGPFAPVRKILEANEMASRVRRDNVGSAVRVLEGFYGKTAVLAHTGATFDIAQWVNDGKILLIDSSGVEDDQAIVMEQAIIQNIFDICRAGITNKHRIVIDEAQKRVDENVAQQSREIAKFDCALDLLFQNPLDVTNPEIRNLIFGCTFHWWGRMGMSDAAQFAAEDVGTCLLDPLKIHYVEHRVRQVHDGYEFREVENKTEMGGRKGTSKVQQVLSRYGQVTDDVKHYKRYEDQIKDVRQILLGLGKGWFYFRHDKVSPEPMYEPLLKEPWSQLPGYQKKMLAHAIEHIRNKPCYRKPVLLGPTCQNNQPTKAKTAAERLRDGEI